MRGGAGERGAEVEESSGCEEDPDGMRKRRVSAGETLGEAPDGLATKICRPDDPERGELDEGRRFAECPLDCVYSNATRGGAFRCPKLL